MSAQRKPEPIAFATPERAALAAAIDRVAAAKAHVIKVDAADAKVGRVHHAEADREAALLVDDNLESLLLRAEKALHDAQKHRPQHLVAALLADDPAPDPIPALEAAVAEAQRKLDEALRLKELLRAEHRRALDAVVEAEHLRRQAVSAVLKADPNVAAVFAEHERLRGEVRVLREKITAIDRAYGTPDAFTRWNDISAFNEYEIGFGADYDRWSVAIAALADDPNAPLPDPG